VKKKKRRSGQFKGRLTWTYGVHQTGKREKTRKAVQKKDQNTFCSGGDGLLVDEQQEREVFLKP